MTEFNLIEAV